MDQLGPKDNRMQRENWTLHLLPLLLKHTTAAVVVIIIIIIKLNINLHSRIGFDCHICVNIFYLKAGVTKLHCGADKTAACGNVKLDWSA